MAQLNSALDYGSRGYRFESYHGHKKTHQIDAFFYFSKGFRQSKLGLALFLVLISRAFFLQNEATTPLPRDLINRLLSRNHPALHSPSPAAFDDETLISKRWVVNFQQDHETLIACVWEQPL